MRPPPRSGRRGVFCTTRSPAERKGVDGQMNQWDSKPSINEREMRGQSIAQNFGWVRRVDETTYMVHSQRLDREYRVEQTETGWLCECPDSQFRGMKCKHVWGVEISWTLRKRVEQS